MHAKKILVVDGCRISVLLLKHIVTKLGVRVDSAGDGKEGLDLALKNNYPLIFLDVTMPKLDGFEVCRRIRAAELESQPRIIILTAMGEDYPAAMGKNAGADAVIFKPIVPSQIAEMAREAVREPAACVTA